MHSLRTPLGDYLYIMMDGMSKEKTMLPSLRHFNSKNPPPRMGCDIDLALIFLPSTEWRPVGYLTCNPEAYAMSDSSKTASILLDIILQVPPHQTISVQLGSHVTFL